MLSAKPWKADAVMRLGISVIVCVFVGALLLSVLHYAGTGGSLRPLLFYLLAAAAFVGLATPFFWSTNPGHRMPSPAACSR